MMQDAMMHDATIVPLDASTLRLEFAASLGPLPVHGRFRTLRGRLVLPVTDIASASLEVDVDADSVDTGLAARDRHLRGASFLNVARHPRITFVSRLVSLDGGDLLVAGRMTLCGVPRDVVTRCPVPHANSAATDGSIALFAELDIPIREYGIGVPRGLDVLNPIFLAVGRQVRVTVALAVPASRLLPALLPAPGR